MEELDRDKLDKLDKLAGFIMILRLPQGTVKQECVEDAYKNAKAVASELFPPQAAPLVKEIMSDTLTLTKAKYANKGMFTFTIEQECDLPAQRV